MKYYLILSIILLEVYLRNPDIKIVLGPLYSSNTQPLIVYENFSLSEKFDLKSYS